MDMMMCSDLKCTFPGAPAILDLTISRKGAGSFHINNLNRWKSPDIVKVSSR